MPAFAPQRRCRILALLAVLLAGQRAGCVRPYDAEQERLPGWKGEVLESAAVAGAKPAAATVARPSSLRATGGSAAAERPAEQNDQGAQPAPPDTRPLPPSKPARWEGEILELSWEPRVTVFKSFLTPEECDTLIALSKPKMTQSTVVDPKSGARVPSEVRTSTGTFFQLGEHPVLREIEARISAVTHLPPVNGEGIQVLHYAGGQRYDQHHDFLIDDVNPAPENGGQRVITFLMYLTTVEEGGETLFPVAQRPLPEGPEYDSLRPVNPSECAAHGGLAIAPKRGDALMFHSLKPDLSKDYASLHASCPTLRGDKWSATKWLRLDAYSGNLTPAANAARKAQIDMEKHCKDWNTQCGMWAFSGECERNRSWMNVQCQRSCHACAERAPRSPPAAQERPPNDVQPAEKAKGGVLTFPRGIQAVRESDETL